MKFTEKSEHKLTSCLRVCALTIWFQRGQIIIFAYRVMCVFASMRICVFAVLRVCGFACLRVLYLLMLCLDLGWVVMNIFMNRSTDFIVSNARRHIYVWISITHHMFRPYVLSIDIFWITVVIWARVINNIAWLGWGGGGVGGEIIPVYW